MRSNSTNPPGLVAQRIMAPLLFAQFDADGDGRVTRAEFDKAPTPGFDRADSNNDGRISMAETKAVTP